MGKTDDKGEPVKTVTIGGKKVEVPIIFILPEEAGEKEIERYEHPKVHIKKDDKAAESKEEPLEELTDGKLEEVEKPKFVAPKIAGGYGKAQALKRTKELQDKRRAEEEKALYIEGGAREKDIENQSKKSWESWLDKKSKQTNIDKPKDWWDHSKVGDPDNWTPPKKHYDKDGNRIPEKGQGEGKAEL